MHPTAAACGSRLRPLGLALALAPLSAGLPAPAAAPAPASQKKESATLAVPRGVSMSDLEQGARPAGFDTNTAFAKKTNKVNLYFIIIGIVAGVLIIGLIIYALSLAKNGSHQ